MLIKELLFSAIFSSIIVCSMVHLAHAQSQHAREFIADVRSFNEKIKRNAIAYSKSRSKAIPSSNSPYGTLRSSDGTDIVSLMRLFEEDSPWQRYLKQQFVEGLPHDHRIAHDRLIENIHCHKAVVYEHRGFYNLYPELRDALSDPVAGRIFREYILPIHSYRHRLCLALRFLAPAVANARLSETSIYFYRFDLDRDDWHERKNEMHFRLSIAIAIVDQSAICKGLKPAMAFLLRNQRELSYDTYHPEGFEWIKYWLGKPDIGRVGTASTPTISSSQMEIDRREELKKAQRKSCSARLEYLYKHIQPDG